MCIRDRREAGDIKALIHEQKQMQEHTTAELGFLRGDVGELPGELNNQIIRISDVKESMSTKIYAVENSMAKIRGQIKSEIEHFIKIQPKQISEQTVPIIKTEKTLKMSQ